MGSYEIFLRDLKPLMLLRLTVRSLRDLNERSKAIDASKIEGEIGFLMGQRRKKKEYF